MDDSHVHQRKLWDETTNRCSRYSGSDTKQIWMVTLKYDD